MLLAPPELALGALVVFLVSFFRFGAIFIMAHKLSSCMHCDDTKLSPLASIHLFHPSTGACHVIARCLVLFLVLCVFVFLFVWFGVVFGALVCFASFCVLDDRDSIQDYVSVLHQFTFAATLQRRLTHDLINQLIPITTCFQTC